MTYATLATIHRLLETEKEAQQKALDLVRQNRNKAQDDYDYAVSHDHSEEYIEEAKKHLIFTKGMYDKVWAACCEARDALEDFSAHDFR